MNKGWKLFPPAEDIELGGEGGGREKGRESPLKSWVCSSKMISPGPGLYSLFQMLWDTASALSTW